MDTVLDILTSVTVWLGDIVFGVLSIFSPTVTLWFLSAITGIIMLVLWRYTSNQDGIADARRKISAHLLSTRLFKDNLSVTFRAQRQIIWQSFRILRYSVVPVLVMTAPFVLVMVQLGLRYEQRPLEIGKYGAVTATLKSEANVLTRGARLELPDGLRHDPMDPCRVVARRTVDWRITPVEPGEYILKFGEGEDRVEIPLTAGDSFVRISSFRGGGFWDRLLYSAEPSIPKDSCFESIRIDYPARSTPIIFGWEVHWLITLLVLSLVFALVFKPILKVHI